MEYIYGEFSDAQVNDLIETMHSEIHKLLLYKDPKVNEFIFESDAAFTSYFINLLYRFGGLNKILGEPIYMVAFMSTLRAAYDECQSAEYDYQVFRRLILDAHGYIKQMFEEGVTDAGS